MSNLQLPNVTGYTSADAYLGDRQSARLGHNTTIRRGPGDDIVVTYHATDIITYCSDGTIILRANGWVTATTANRLNKLTPAHVIVGRQLGDFRITTRGPGATLGEGQVRTYFWDGHGTFQIAAPA